MPRKKENLQIVTLRLTKGAVEKLTTFYPKLSYNLVVRVLVDKHLEQLERQAAELLNRNTTSIEMPSVEEIAEEIAVAAKDQ